MPRSRPCADTVSDTTTSRSALPDPVRQKVDDEIAAGRILVIVDANAETHARLAGPMAQAGVSRLDYEATSALS